MKKCLEGARPGDIIWCERVRPPDGDWCLVVKSPTETDPKPKGREGYCVVFAAMYGASKSSGMTALLERGITKWWVLRLSDKRVERRKMRQA